MFKYFLNTLVAVTLLVTPYHTNASSTVKVGAQVLHETGYSALNGKRIGLIANHTAVVGKQHVVDLMSASGKVRLEAIFAPEHGVYGLKEDGEKIEESRDESTEVEVYSLYGEVKKPTPEMMDGLDMLLFDIQDIGARFYTYISTMGLAMQAAAEKRIPFVILDRPNPLGGEYVGGPVLDEEYISFTGSFPIPVAHGMTVGELALMIKGEQMFPGLEELDLRVIKMSGWKRDMQWPDTRLEWIRTSPNIPDFETALLYPGICLFEGTAASVGRGTMTPFKLIGIPGIATNDLAETLNNSKLPGVRFDATILMPKSIPGMSSNPKYQDREIPAIKITVLDPESFQPVETGIHLLSTLYKALSTDERERFFRPSGFDNLAGTERLRLAIGRGISANEIIDEWNDELDIFIEGRESYLLY